MSAGTVYLVGAGPGAADLLTVRAERLLREADIVLHDALVAPEVLALAARATLVPVGKRCGGFSITQREINARLVEAAQRHRVVVRLKGGDPMLFGRAQEELDALARAGVTAEVVPGVSSAFAASAALGRSLTARGISRSVAFLTPAVGTAQPAGDWSAAARGADTLVLYMASRRTGEIARGLMDAGIPPDRCAVIVENASLPGERIIRSRVARLARDAAALGEGPALLLVGDALDAARAETVPGTGTAIVAPAGMATASARPGTDRFATIRASPRRHWSPDRPCDCCSSSIPSTR